MTKQDRQINLDCGCILHRIVTTEKNQWGDEFWSTRETTLKECNQHKKIRLKRLKKLEDFKKFPSQLSREIYDILNKMIDDLEETRVDVSHFPDEANDVLKETAIKLSKMA